MNLLDGHVRGQNELVPAPDFDQGGIIPNAQLQVRIASRRARLKPANEFRLIPEHTWSLSRPLHLGMLSEPGAAGNG